jgi:hypothetical protein
VYFGFTVLSPAITASFHLTFTQSNWGNLFPYCCVVFFRSLTCDKLLNHNIHLDNNIYHIDNNICHLDNRQMSGPPPPNRPG